MEVMLDDNSRCIDFSLDQWMSFVTPLVGMDHVLAIKRLKYVTSYWYAKFLHDELPEKDVPSWDPWLFQGGIRRYLRTRMISCTARNAKLFYSLLQAKRACDPVPESFVQAALEKHRKALGRVEAPLADDLKQKIRMLTRRIVSRWPRFSDRQCEPSHSACYEIGRSRGGQAKELMLELGDCVRTKDLVGVCEGFKQLDGHPLTDRFAKCLKRLVEPDPDDLVAMVETTPGCVSERRGWLMPSRSAMLYAAMVHEEGNYFVSKIPLPGGDQRIILDDDALGLRTENGFYIPYQPGKGQMTAGVSAVLEPLKVRTVTKGRARAYNAVHGVQKWMHSSLREERVFK
jgi:hypothetical protein